MWFNYLKIAFRNLARHKAYSAINILGLSLGVACCLLLTLYIQDERAYDQHHRDLKDIYRITSSFETEKGLDQLVTASPPIAMALRDEIPEVVSATRALNPPGIELCLIRYGDNQFYERDGYLADSTLFEVLTYNLVEGNPKTALVLANSVVLSDKLAKKLFGEQSALDKSIHITQGGSAETYRVTGVFLDNTKSHFHANFFTSMTSHGWGDYMRSPEAMEQWAGQNFVPSYVKLVPGHDLKSVIAKMNEVLVKFGADDMKALGLKKTLGLEPVGDIYLRSDIRQSPRITYLYVIGSIALFILLIACINFMNLTTAKAAQRAAEIGVRKVMGAYRSSLIRQLLGEAVFIVLIAMLISVVIVQAALPVFNELTGKEIQILSGDAAGFLGMLIAIALLTALAAGSYPAFYLSSFEPSRVLKGKVALSHSGGWLRRSLVIFQFMIAIALVCGMLTISDQLRYIQNANLGFDASAKVILPLRTRDAREQFNNLNQSLKTLSQVKAVSSTEYIPGNPVYSDMLFYRDGKSMEDAVMIRRNSVSYGYLEMMNIPIVAGRSFTDNFAVESQKKVIINEAGAKRLDFTPEEIVGEHISFDYDGTHYSYEVIGVMKDYHQQSLHEKIEPLLFEMSENTNRQAYVVASVNPENFDQTVNEIQNTWRRLIPGTPFEFSFADENISKQYGDDRRMARIISGFTIIAMLISCLGLYGLSSYMAERRYKEIGVRKVMGASVGEIVRLMSLEFVKLVVIAFVIATPLAWYAMTQWLKGFAYHVDPQVIVFVLAGVAALAIALFTVSFESVRAATANPVHSLRTE